jgi:hypothetical protein
MKEVEIKNALKAIDVKPSEKFKANLDTKLKYEAVNKLEKEDIHNFYFFLPF